MHLPSDPSLSPCPKLLRTPSTHSDSSTHELLLNAEVSQFLLPAEPSMTRHTWHNLPEEKENEQHHATDRFIPLRKMSSLSPTNFNVTEADSQQCRRGQAITDQKVTLNEVYKSLLLDKDKNKFLLFGSGKESSQLKMQSSNFSELREPKLTKKCASSQYRKIGKAPFKVLDAPNLQDDFYLNLLEWSSQNVLSVALQSSLYFWNGNNNKVLRFCDLSPDLVSSVNWNQSGSQIAVGTSKGVVEIWDATKACKMNEYSGHSQRVSSVAWSGNILASGSRDRTINVRDIRERSSLTFSKHVGHTQQVCGLKWSFDGSLLASGGNDNKLFVWSAHSVLPISKFSQHSAAVKGLAWSPHNHGVLASGGGSADKTIKFWNTLDNSLLDSIDTGSQVCNLLFSKNTKELVSTHGYSNNEIIVWKYPTLEKMATLTGHTSRVLFLAMNPTGQTIVTGAGDETLRFWNVFPSKFKKDTRPNLLSTMELR